jgi:hypothetical protein
LPMESLIQITSYETRSLRIKLLSKVCPTFKPDVEATFF